MLLLGYPGTGKYTIAKELVRQAVTAGSVVRLVDNHTASNIVFDLIAESDGRSALPEGIVKRVREINYAVLRTIAELSPTNWSFVLTHHLVDTPEIHAYLADLESVATGRGGALLVVVLSCSREALIERVVRADRWERNKLVDPERALEIAERGMLDPPGALHLDITDSTPSETAAAILTTLVD